MMTDPQPARKGTPLTRAESGPPPQPVIRHACAIAEAGALRPARQAWQRRWWILLLPCALFAALLATLLAGPLHTSVAASSASVCLTAPATQKPLACNGEDPIVENCVSDAHTGDQVLMRMGKQVIGRLELRFSQRCGTYWGRLFSSLPRSYLSLQVVDLGSGPIGSFFGPFSEIYSNMFCRHPTLFGSILIDYQQVGAQQMSASLTPPPGQ